jgi:uncharacterized damage-inducible protein DinB
MNEIRLLLAMLDEAFERSAWHGPNLRGSLRGVTARQAAWRPAPGRHSIWELAVHAAYWKYAVRRRLTGESRGSFPHKGSNWFESPAAPTERAWRADLALLGGEHARLRSAVARLSPSDLPKKAGGSRRTVATLVYGVASHDVYHTGQISLLKRLWRDRGRSSRAGR